MYFLMRSCGLNEGQVLEEVYAFFFDVAGWDAFDFRGVEKEDVYLFYEIFIRCNQLFVTPEGA